MVIEPNVIYKHVAQFNKLIPMQKEEYREGKLFVPLEKERDDAHQLAHRVLQSGFRPTHMVALWRGGARIALYMHEYMELATGLKVDCVTVRTSLYENQQAAQREVRVHGEQYLVDVLQAEHRLLFVDDILESGRSLGALRDVLALKLGARMPRQCKVAVMFTKSEKWQWGQPTADFFVRDVPEYCWVVFGHELESLSLPELQRQMSPASIDRLTEDMGLSGLDLDDTGLTEKLATVPLHWSLAHRDWVARRALFENESDDKSAV
jgi:hypoxanthine phosphoribosyltransferase